MAKSYKDTITRGRLSERLQCPMCGWIRPINYGVSKRTGEIRKVRFDKINLVTAPLWRLERLTGMGRGSKEASIELIESKRLTELPNELKSQIKNQCQKILEILGS